MKRISIERYTTPTAGYAGLIEGETDGGSRWIMYLDDTGKPEVYWADRTKDGSVAGHAIRLDPDVHEKLADARAAKLKEIVHGDPDPAFVVKRLKEAIAAGERINSGVECCEGDSKETVERMIQMRHERLGIKPLLDPATLPARSLP